MTFIEESMIGGIIGGFISKVINDGADVSKDKIRKADKNRKSEYQNFETRIYQVIIDALNEFTYNKYKDQDILYNVAESILNYLKNGEKDKIDAVKIGLLILNSNVDDTDCERFIKVLCHEISKETNFDVYKEILLLLLEHETKYNCGELQQIKEQLKIIREKLEDNDLNSDVTGKEDKICQKVKSRTQEYADKWNANMFLNDFDKRDKKAGINVKLKEIYLEEHLPHYIWGGNDGNEISMDLKELLSEYINEKKDNKMLLILGQPGIGKSTLITWIIANFEDKKNDILVYKFASDLKSIDWQKSNLSWKILEKLNFSYNDLNGKTMILDGFDEVNIGDNRRNILDNLYGDWVYGQRIKNFSLIITCRENYVQGFERAKCSYITLQAWSKEQIESFCNIFQKKTENKISWQTIYNIILNKEILGIPLILYMVLALNIAIEKSGSIVDVYDRIFALDGGIYERCIDNKNFADKHRITKIKKQIHQISKEIAMCMFENNSEDASISQGMYEKICENIAKEQDQNNIGIKQDVKIGSYFKSVKHCEGVETDELCFVHRSIYEYFVAETIYSSIENYLLELSEESQIKLAGNIACYLKEGDITNSIGEYLKYKILNIYNKLDDRKKNKFIKWWETTLKLMLERGMFYYVENGIRGYDRILIKELKCFRNIMYISTLLADIYPKGKYILEDTKTIYLQMYLRLIDVPFPYVVYGIKPSQFILHKIYLQNANLIRIRCVGIDLTGANMSGVDLRESDLSKARLRETNLRRAKLSRADLSRVRLDRADLQEAILQEVNLKGATLVKANLRKTDLQRAYLRKADFSRADLREANMREANLNRANFKEANLNKVDLTGANLSGANLNGIKLSEANLSYSIWRECDIKKVSSQLRKAYFDYLIIEDQNEQRKLYKSDLITSKNILQ